MITKKQKRTIKKILGHFYTEAIQEELKKVKAVLLP